MVYSPLLLDRLQAVEPEAWGGTVLRHMFAAHPPEKENIRGARWNPQDTAAIYTSLTREGVLAEAEHQLDSQPIRPRVRRTIYTVQVTLDAVLDLTDMALLDDLGVGAAELVAVDMRACQDIGGAAAWLDCDGILVPSARSSARNLVIFPAKRSPHAAFEVVSDEDVTDAA